MGERIPSVTGRLKEVVEDQDLDLIDLLLPIEAMPDPIKLFLNSRKHVISEKPCAPSIASGIELMELYARFERPPLWAVAENWRFKKTVKIVEDIVRDGAIGEMQFADFTYLAFQRPNNLGWRGSPNAQAAFSSIPAFILWLRCERSSAKSRRSAGR